MERNYSKMLKQLQLGYMVVTMEEVEETHDQCVFCWKSNCGCENKETVLDSVFLNFEDVPFESVQNKFVI